MGISAAGMALHLFLCLVAVVALAHLLAGRIPDWLFVLLPCVFFVPDLLYMDINWGTFPDWVSAIFTAAGVILAIVAYANWKSDEFNKRKISLHFDLLDLASQYFRAVRQGTESEATEISKQFDFILIDKSHFLDNQTIRAIGAAQIAADDVLSMKGDGEDSMQKGLDFHNSVMSLKETLALKTAPFGGWLMLWRRKRSEEEFRALINRPLTHKRRENAD